MKTGSKWWKFSFWRKLVSNTLIIWTVCALFFSQNDPLPNKIRSQCYVLVGFNNKYCTLRQFEGLSKKLVQVTFLQIVEKYIRI
jgi:hypothetical protein